MTLSETYNALGIRVADFSGYDPHQEFTPTVEVAAVMSIAFNLQRIADLFEAEAKGD